MLFVFSGVIVICLVNAPLHAPLQSMNVGGLLPHAVR
jgi:hypothetical protein